MPSLLRDSFRSVSLVILLASLTSCGTGAPEAGKNGVAAMKSIAVTQIVEHPSLDAVRDGIKEELGRLGYTEGKTLKWTWQSAQGNPATAAQIAQQLVGEAPDVLVGISTPSAQAVMNSAGQRGGKIPVVFAAVTDPVGAKLVQSLEKPGGIATGVTDLSPVGKHLALIQEILPKAKTIGVVYNAGEPNSVALLKLLKQEAPKLKLTIVEATATNTATVATAAQNLVGQVDAIYVPTDNTVASALESVIQVGRQNKLPVFAGDNDSVKRGAIASLSFDYRELGRETAQIVDRVLKGEAPGTIPVVVPQKLDLVVNPPAAQAMGVTLPQSLLSRAKTVLK
jgi:putative tryptophan/tyrosine transport system substrate-binding protein